MSFDESKHPRADDGEFGKGSGGSSSGKDVPAAAQKSRKAFIDHRNNFVGWKQYSTSRPTGKGSGEYDPTSNWDEDDEGDDAEAWNDPMRQQIEDQVENALDAVSKRRGSAPVTRVFVRSEDPTTAEPGNGKTQFLGSTNSLHSTDFADVSIGRDHDTGGVIIEPVQGRGKTVQVGPDDPPELIERKVAFVTGTKYKGEKVKSPSGKSDWTLDDDEIRESITSEGFGMRIRESIESDAVLQIDEEKCIVYGVKILGSESRNGIAFPRESRVRSHKVLEGAFSNWNHKPKGSKEPPPPNDRFGWFTGIREDDSSDCTRGDLHYIPEHEHAKHFIGMAKRNPRMISISVLGDARTDGVDRNGRKIVTEIVSCESLDIVSKGGNTRGLREAEEAPAAPAEATSEGDYAADGCVKAIEEVIAAGGASREKLKAIKEHLAKLEEMEGDGEEGEEKVEESAKAKIRKDCIQLCESEGLKDADDGFLNILQNVPEVGRLKVVKDYQLKRAARKPKSGTPTIPIQESAKAPAAELKPEDEVNRIANLLRG